MPEDKIDFEIIKDSLTCPWCIAKDGPSVSEQRRMGVTLTDWEA